MNIPDIPDDLVKDIVEHKCVAFVGAGLSHSADLPDWSGLMHMMIDFGVKSGLEITQEEKTEFSKLIRQDKLLLVAQAMRERLGDGDFHKFMVQIFEKDGIKPMEIHKIITRIPFSAIFTTNYDNLLESAYILTHNGQSPRIFTHLDKPELALAPHDNSFYIFKAHGTVDRIETIILGRRDYREAIQNSAYLEYLKVVLSSKTILFLGYSLTDYDLRLLLDELSVVFRDYNIKHYALMNKETITSIEADRFMKDHHIQILAYEKTAPDHPEVLEFLKRLEYRCQPGYVRVLGTVKLVNRPDLPQAIEQSQAFEGFLKAMAETENPFLQTVKEDEPADYQVAVNEEGEYVVMDAAGAVIENLRPPLSIYVPEAPKHLIQRLEHIARYHTIQQLDNPDPFSTLQGKLMVKLTGKRAKYDPAEAFEPEEFFPESTQVITLTAGDWYGLQIKNASDLELNVMVLDFQPDWGITLIYEDRLKEGNDILLPLQVFLPTGYSNGTDVIKFFGSVGSVGFPWIEIETLGQTWYHRRIRSAPTDFEHFLIKLTEEGLKERNLDPSAYVTFPWVTAHVEVHVQSPVSVEERIQQLNQEVVSLQRQGEYQRGLVLAQESLALARKTLDESHPNFAASLNNLASLYFSMGRYTDAEPLYLQAMEIGRKVLGEDHPDFATNINNLALLYSRMARYTEAKRLYGQAMEIRRKALGEEHPDLAVSLNNLARLYSRMARYADAEPIYRQALEIYRKALGEGDPGFAAILNNLAELYSSIGRYADAETLYRQAVEIRRKALGEEHPDFAASLNNLAGLYSSMCRYADAEPLYLRAREIYRKALGEEHPDFATSLNNLAELYSSMGRYTDAEPLCLQSLEIDRKALGEGHPDFAKALNNLADLYSSMGRYTDAEALYLQAIEIRRKVLGDRHPDFATSLSNLALLYSSMARYADAEPLYRQAIEIYCEIFGEEHPDFIASLNSLGKLYSRMDRYADAETLYLQVMELRRKVLGENHSGFIANLNDLVSLYLIEGDYTKAEISSQQAMELAQNSLGDMHLERIRAATNLAKLLTATKRPEEAFDCLSQVTSRLGLLASHLSFLKSEGIRETYLENIEECVDVFLSLVVQHLPPSAVYQIAAFECVLCTKLALVDTLAGSRYHLLTRKYPAFKDKLESLLSLRWEIAWKIFAVDPAGIDMDEYRRELYGQQDRAKTLGGELAYHIPEIWLAQYLYTADRYTVSESLPQGSALVEYVRFRVLDFKAVPARGDDVWKSSRYIAFVICADSPDRVSMFDLGEAETIDKLAGEVLATITDSTISSIRMPEAEDKTPGLELRKIIFDTLRDAMGHGHQIIIAPDGDLSHLTFGVLTTDDGRFLLDDYQFSYLQSGRDALRFKKISKSEPNQSLVIANPDFNLSVVPTPQLILKSGQYAAKKLVKKQDTIQLVFQQVPGTALEAEQTAKALDASLWMGDRVLKNSLKAFYSPRILHIAAPVFFLSDKISDVRPRNPLMAAGIALSGANNSSLLNSLSPDVGDGVLVAHEIAELDLLGTELVVLSYVMVNPGDDLVSIQRAFILAGARNLIISTIKAPDKETTILMDTFYHLLVSGKSPATALREAQLAFKELYPHPRYWGSFICLGDLSPVTIYRPFEKADNPYIVGLPVKGPSFVGRADILRMVQDNLAPGAARNILVLQGQRRTGKTSVLYKLREILPVNKDNIYVPILVDLQGISGIKNESDFFHLLAYNIREGLGNQGIDVPESLIDDFEKNPRMAFEYKFLIPVTKTLENDRQLLLMLDEFDYMKSFIESGILGHDILDHLRHLMQHRQLLFLLAGTYKLKEFTGGYWSVFFNLSVPVEIGIMSSSDARTLITAPVARWYTIQPEAVDEIVHITGCHPYFIQMICSKLLEVRNQYRVNNVNLSHVGEAVNNTLRDFNNHIGFPWEEQDCIMEERLVMAVMAREEKEEIPVAMETIEQKLRDEGYNIDVQITVKRLLVRGVLRRGQKDQLTFVVPLFQRWLVSNKKDNPIKLVQYKAEQYR